MRVIAGSCKGRRLQPPTWSGLRPTSDRLRETIFDILADRVVAARVLDGYAGTGALGIEALSRGAAHVTFVERDPRAQALIARNAALCGLEERYVIIRTSVPGALETMRDRQTSDSAASDRYDIVLLDPPYEHSPATPRRGIRASSPTASSASELPSVIAAAGAVLADTGILVLEHARKWQPPAAAGRLVLTRDVVAGDSALAFYQCRL